jgi:hypothetical protein
MTYLTLALFAYILGYLIKARINPPVGETIQLVAAISYVALQLLVWLGVL